ncbi:Transmembrane and TPR repeat-containing protein 3 [Nymphon striatum]|nr:Transmembrane and TPR repeat-containing protein 3 [Nymphon striatum]
MKVEGSMYTYHLGFISLVSIACYLNALNGDLVFDDIPVIRDNKDLKPSTPFSNIFNNDFWGTPISSERSHKSYRPLTIISFRINYFFHELQPFGYHLLNILLHLTDRMSIRLNFENILIYKLLILFFLSTYRLCSKFVHGKSAFIAALLFAIHPIHTEAVSSIVGRAEMLSAIFFLLALLTFLQSYEKITHSSMDIIKVSLLGGIAMLCKEQGATVLPLCILTDLLMFQKVKEDSTLSLQRHWTEEHTGQGQDLWFKCLYNLMDILLGFRLTLMYLAAYNSWLMLFPSSLCCDWTMSSIPLLKSVFDIRNIFTLAFLYAAFKLFSATRIFTRDRKIDRGLLMIVVPFIPASNLLFTVGFVIAERVLYIPSMGFCLLVAHGFHILLSKFSKQSNSIYFIRSHGKSKILKIFLVILLASHFLKTLRRNNDWHDEHSLYSSALKINPKNAKILNNMGKAFENEDQYEKALSYYSKSISEEPEDIVGYINKGRVYNNLNMFEEAENILKKNLCVPSEEAEGVAEVSALVTSSHGGNEQITRIPESASTVIQLVQEGDILQALENLNKALEIEPDHEPSLLNSAMLIQKHQVSNETLTAYHRLNQPEVFQYFLCKSPWRSV